MDIMKAILDIESKAQGIINTLDEIQEENDKQIAQELKEIEEQMKVRANSKVEEYKAELDEKTHREIIELEKLMDTRRQTLEKTFNEKYKQWVKEITEAVVKDDSL